MTEFILLSIFVVFMILFIIYSRTKKLRENFRHNLNDEQIAIEPPKPKARRSLEDTLKTLTQRHELPKIEEEVNVAENLLQEVKDRRAKELIERNKSLRDIPEKKPIIPRLGTPIVESRETKRLREQLNRGRRSNQDIDNTMNRGNQNRQNQSMNSDEARYDNYKTKEYSTSKYKTMMQNPDSVKDAFVVSEIFKTKF